MSRGFYGFLYGRKPEQMKSAQDESVPKNESLLEHRKHCRAKEGNCPFEKALAKSAVKEDSVAIAPPKKPDERDSWKNYTIWKCQYNLINAFKKDIDKLTQDQSRLVANLANGSVYAGDVCDYLRVHNRNLTEEQRQAFESLDLARKISEAAAGTNRQDGWGFNASDIRGFVEACKEIDDGKMPSKEGIVPAICVTPESARAYIFSRLEDANFDEVFSLLKDGKYDDLLNGNEDKHDGGDVDQHDFDKMKVVIAEKLDNKRPITSKELTDALAAYMKNNPVPDGAAEKHEFVDGEGDESVYENRFVERDEDEADEVQEYFETFLDEIGVSETWKHVNTQEVSDGRDGTDLDVCVTVKCNLAEKDKKGNA